MKKEIGTTDIEDVINDTTYSEVDKIKYNKDIRNVIGKIYGLGILTGEERSKFNSEAAYKEWKKNKVDHEEILEELISELARNILEKDLKYHANPPEYIVACDFSRENNNKDINTILRTFKKDGILYVNSPDFNDYI